MQDAKLIDLTRSYVPVNPNVFPETMHATEREDTPENRFPVIPYKGFNFLPTSYGYKSFFGTNSALDFATLSPNKPEQVFMFQTEDYKNFLIALCDTGIWAKNTSTGTGEVDGGLWFSLIAFAVPEEDVFYEWYYEMIKNKLYCYRANGSFFYVIVSDPDSEFGITASVNNPSFITAGSQIGMGRLGARLVFWDTNNAIAWSSADNLADFTPMVITGANVTTFNSVLGKISAIRPHGRHAIVYASKAIVLLEIQPGETFLVKATPIVIGSGCAYYRQSIHAVPDNIHFAYTSTGIVRIENAKHETIIPEVFDYFKELTVMPIYLRILQGRFLFFCPMDENAVYGKAAFEKVVLPGDVTVLEDLPDSNELDPANAPACELLGNINEITYTEQKEYDESDPNYPPEDQRAPGSVVERLYTCYISSGNGPAVPPTFVSVPCGSDKLNGGKFTPSPADIGALGLSNFTTTASGKTPKYGPDAWTDGKWTMERFIQYQSAIWKEAEAKYRAWLSAVGSRKETDSKTETNTSVCVAGSTGSACAIGTVPMKFSPYAFGYNACSFWLTRLITQLADIANNVTVTTSCSNGETDDLPPDYYTNSFNESHYGSPGAAAAAVNGTFTPSSNNSFGPAGATSGTSDIGHAASDIEGQPDYNIRAHWSAPSGKVLWQSSFGNYLPGVYATYPDGFFDKVEVQRSVNQVTPGPEGVWGIETAFCVVTGYRYVNAAGETTTTAAGQECNDTGNYAPGEDPGADERGGTLNVPPINGDGSLCDEPFETPVDDPLIEWPDETVSYPPTSFLLQDGSIAPRYPTFVGAFVYDLHLKKWGKMQNDFKQLVDYSPANSDSSSTVDFATFGILAGLFKEDGFIYLFDDIPEESELTYGKIGYYRAGITNLQTLRVDFKRLFNGSITIEHSMDGNALASDMEETYPFNSVRQALVHPIQSSRWMNIKFTGNFDISVMQMNMYKHGRR